MPTAMIPINRRRRFWLSFFEKLAHQRPAIYSNDKAWTAVSCACALFGCIHVCCICMTRSSKTLLVHATPSECEHFTISINRVFKAHAAPWYLENGACGPQDWRVPSSLVLPVKFGASRQVWCFPSSLQGTSYWASPVILGDSRQVCEARHIGRFPSSLRGTSSLVIPVKFGDSRQICECRQS